MCELKVVGRTEELVLPITVQQSPVRRSPIDTGTIDWSFGVRRRENRSIAVAQCREPIHLVTPAQRQRQLRVYRVGKYGAPHLDDVRARVNAIVVGLAGVLQRPASAIAKH